MAAARTTLTTVLSMNNTKFKKGLSGSKKSLNSFQKQIGKIGGMIAGAFAITALVRFGREAVQLAAKLQGIESAFAKLDDPKLLDDLRAATRGMVSDLELMRQAVRAKNFAIPLKDLATFFEFATKRSLETGESVDYLVNSIIDGIGRKSTLVMDNLGISSVALQNEIKKTGDFAVAAGNLIKQGIEDMGEVADTAMVALVAAQATWDNFKAKAGGLFLEAAAGQIEYMKARRVLLDGEDIDWMKKLWVNLTNDTEAVTELAEHFRLLNAEIDEGEEVVNAYAGVLDRVVKSGIDWADVTATIFKQWVTENDIIKAQIALREKLIGAINATRLAKLAELNEIIAAYDKIKKAEKDARDKALKESTHDTFANVDFGGAEVWMGGTEDWEQYEDSVNATVEKMAKLKATTKEFGNLVSQTLVSQFDRLGEAIGKFASGAEDSFRGLGDAIMQNLGNILIMMGAQTGNLGLVLAGAAIQLGGGILRGLGSNSNNQSINRAPGGEMRFRLEGNDLVTVLNRNNYSNNLNT